MMKHVNWWKYARDCVGNKMGNDDLCGCPAWRGAEGAHTGHGERKGALQ